MQVPDYYWEHYQQRHLDQLVYYSAKQLKLVVELLQVPKTPAVKVPVALRALPVFIVVATVFEGDTRTDDAKSLFGATPSHCLLL